ncbi:DUF4124 domain-containing protein [Glaciimonas soli]|uniref:DUF4124 domain-containing protein n=1 Tax=Glaciimonas soli TaxID=2590999 RepID=A0A843YXK8_9BURK|nr:DUF4124 domain-containing protein [Glaciimonas soli]MQR02404.1 DUF4124 domain-containing protein [Glaciimonas soli]
MKRLLPILIALNACFLVNSAAHAQSTVYVCESNGVKEYKNTGDTKGCKKADLPALTITHDKAPSSGDNTARRAASATPATPSDFPKVDGGTQKKRDDDRRQILQDELAAKQKKMADLQSVYNNGAPERQGNEHNYAKYQERVATMKDDINRTQQDIDALNRELAK